MLQKNRKLSPPIGLVLVGCVLLPIRRNNVNSMYGGMKELRTYKQIRSTCSWKASLVDEVDFRYKHLTAGEWNTETSAAFRASLSTCHGCPVTIVSCEHQLLDGDHIIIYRVGPFKSWGGFDWHRFAWRPRLPDALKHNAFLVAGAIVPVSEDGEVIPYPPLHPHHWHISTPDTQQRSMLFQTHGDSACKEAEGGTGCYFQALETGFGFPLHEGRVWMHGETNDVRAINSTLKVHWVEGTVTLSQRNLTRALYLQTGFPAFATKEFSFVKTDTFQVRDDGESILWYEFSCSFSCGQASSFWLHTHHHMTRDIAIFKASPQQLGLSALDRTFAITTPYSWLPAHSLIRYPTVFQGRAYNLASLNATIDGIRSMIARTSRSDVLVCEYPEPRQLFEYVPKDFFWQGTEAGYYERYSTRCPSITMREGDVYTVVGFFAPTLVGNPVHDFHQHLYVSAVIKPCE